MNSADITQEYAELAQQPGKVARNDGDAAAALKGAAKTFERVYEVPFLAHAPMEPMNCTADVRADRLRRLGADAGPDRVASGGDGGQRPRRRAR